MKTSSTSSSSGGLARSLPLAALLAAALVLGIDRTLFGIDGVFGRLAVDDANSAARAWLELRELHEAAPGRPRVAVVGTSQVIDGFDETLAERRMPDASFAKLAYPRFEPFAIRALAPDLVAAGAEAVVLIASELDTHRPLRLEPVPGSSTASLGALADLLRATDARFAIENRTSLYRLVASSALRAYRFRLDLRLAGLDALRVFPSAPRLHGGSPERRDPFRPVALWGAERHPIEPAARRSTMDLFPPRMDPWDARIQAGTLQEITRGPHAAVQMDLYRRAVEVLREAGLAVIVLQGRFHPAARDLYDPALRAEFAAFGRSLAEELGALFVPEAALPPLAESDFYDLIHTNAAGRAKLTAAMLSALERAGRVGPTGARPR